MQETGGQYPAGKFKRECDDVCFTGEEDSRASSSEEEEGLQKENWFTVENNNINRGKRNKNDEKIDTNKIPTFETVTNTEGILGNEEFKINQWSKSGDETQLDDFREENQGDKTVDSHSKVTETRTNVIHNIGDNIGDEIYSRYNGRKLFNESKDKDNVEYSAVRKMAEIGDKEKQHHLNMDTHWFEKTEVQKKYEENAKNVLSSYDINGMNTKLNPNKALKVSEMPSTKIGRLNSLDNSLNGTVTTHIGDKEDNEHILERLDTKDNMDQPFKTSKAMSFQNLSKLLINTRNLAPRRLMGNKVADLEEQKEETVIDNTVQKGCLNKFLITWDRIPRHVKGLLFVVLVFALFAFVLERICLHKTKK